jgi:hypothetical protein
MEQPLALATPSSSPTHQEVLVQKFAEARRVRLY